MSDQDTMTPEYSPLDKLNSALRALAILRQNVDRIQRIRHEMRMRIARTVWGKRLAALSLRYNELCEMATRAKIKVDALTIHAYDGEHKQVAPGASIAVSKKTTYTYDPMTALGWVRENAPALLDVDWEAFEALIDTGKVPPEIATSETRKTPRARIKKDLNFLLNTDDH